MQWNLYERVNTSRGEKLWEVDLEKPNSRGITKQLIELGFSHGRMKTGTPPRLDGRTIDYSKTEEQSGDKNPEKFSYTKTNSLSNDHKLLYNIHIKRSMRH